MENRDWAREIWIIHSKKHIENDGISEPALTIKRFPVLGTNSQDNRLPDFMLHDSSLESFIIIRSVWEPQPWFGHETKPQTTG